MMVSDETIQHVVEVIATHLSPRRVTLFGSYARGEAGPDSDLDLFVELDPPLPARGRSSQIKRLFDPYPGPMDIVVYSPQEVAYWKQAPASLVASVLREGRVLYERDE
jgi:predicted nucleotidyltransferase